MKNYEKKAVPKVNAAAMTCASIGQQFSKRLEYTQVLPPELNPWINALKEVTIQNSCASIMKGLQWSNCVNYFTNLVNLNIFLGVANITIIQELFHDEWTNVNDLMAHITTECYLIRSITQCRSLLFIRYPMSSFRQHCKAMTKPFNILDCRHS